MACSSKNQKPYTDILTGIKFGGVGVRVETAKFKSANIIFVPNA